MFFSGKKKIISLVAVAMAGTLLFSGTFAWQSINQEALNEIRGGINPGGRLHDDFNNVSFDTNKEGEALYTVKTYNKDVYVENFTSLLDDGVQIYARVRLDEYMEIGTGAGTNSADKDVKKVGSSKAKFSDPSTWTTYIYGEDSDFRDYWDLSFGGELKSNLNGQTTYMPTFNKNKDSLAADINGTSAASWADYVNYAYDTENQTQSYYAIYDNDDNDIDELTGNVDLDAIIKGIEPLPEEYQKNVRKSLETHTAKQTLKGEVISMAEWLRLYDKGDNTENFWVYDTDGWAYWSGPIMPQEATALLLDQISRTETPIESTEWYYGINVVAQFITADSLGYKDNTGFFDTSKGKAPTNDALFLLTEIGVDTSEADGTMAVQTGAANDAEVEADDEDALRLAVENGEDIVLTRDIELEDPIVVDRDVVIHLNDCSILPADDFSGDALFVLSDQAWLDFEDNGMVWAPDDGYAVWVESGSHLYIWDGTFVGGVGAIYVEDGEAVILDGIFYMMTENADWLLDWSRNGEITVYGGSFYDFDPTDVLAEDYTVEVSDYGGMIVYGAVLNTANDEDDEPAADTKEPEGKEDVELPVVDGVISGGANAESGGVKDEISSGAAEEDVSGDPNQGAANDAPAADGTDGAPAAGDADHDSNADRAQVPDETVSLPEISTGENTGSGSVSGIYGGAETDGLPVISGNTQMDAAPAVSDVTTTGSLPVMSGETQDDEDPVAPSRGDLNG